MDFINVLIRINAFIKLNDNLKVKKENENIVIINEGVSKYKLSKTYSKFENIIIDFTKKPASFSKTIDVVLDKGTFIMVTEFYSLISFLDEKGFLTYIVPEVVNIIPLSKNIKKRIFNPSISSNYKLSKYAFLQKFKDKAILKTPLNPTLVEIYNKDLIIKLFLETIVKEKQNQENNLIDSAIILLFIFNYIDYEDKVENDFYKWEFHDILLHTNSRYGRQNGDYGATFRYGMKNHTDCIKNLPNTNKVVDFLKPDIDFLIAKSPLYINVIEKRFSSRIFNNIPMKKYELGDFLYLTSRIKEIKSEYDYEISKRPYPSAGSLYELEIYITVLNCDGIEEGIYYYSPNEHKLYFLSGMDKSVKEMISFAKKASKCGDFHVLITISARFQRVLWKYESIAYSLILKNTGVLLQNMSLTATALDLGSCIIGAGNSDNLSNIINESFFEESAVGEIILGKINLD